MAGHSKWANIKHRKGAQDKKKAKIFTRLIKEITIASRDGGPELENNPALRLAVQNAKGQNMPKETIERAIKKGAGGEGKDLTEVFYEGYAPNGIAIFVEATTDNINRTVGAVRAVFNKHGGELGKNGSLSFIFDRKGVFEIEKSIFEGKNSDELEMALIDGGLEDTETEEDTVYLYTAFDDFGAMQKTLETLDIDVKKTELQRIPKTRTSLDLEAAQKVIKLIEKMEEDDDVNVVYHNLEMTEELANSL